MKSHFFIWSHLRCVHKGFCSARPSLIRGGRTRPSWEPAFPTLAATLRATGFPTLANSRGSNSTHIGPYPTAPAPFGPSQRIPDPREFAGVELVLAEPADSRPRPLSTPIPAIEKLAARNYGTRSVQVAKLLGLTVLMRRWTMLNCCMITLFVMVSSNYLLLSGRTLG